MIRRTRFVAGAALGVAMLTVSPFAQELELQTERVVIFKDGTALVVKKASAVPDSEGRVYTEEVPEAAALGCFWAAIDGEAPGDARVGTMRAEFVEEVTSPEDPIAVRSIQELLEANVGRDVRVRLKTSDGPEVSGTIKEVLVAAGLLVLVKEPVGADQGGVTALPISDVHAVLATELITVRDGDATTATKKRLTLELKSADGPLVSGEPVDLRLFYFTPGLRWIPTYRLTGDLDTTGRLNLQAELLNELEDLEGARVDLVVGVPNFRFGKVISPLSLEREMRNALNQAAPNLMNLNNGNFFSNAMFSQVGGDFGAPPPPVATGASVTDIAPELGSTGEQDLFVYHAGIVDLKKGARATLPIWDSHVPIDHLYTYDLDLVRGNGFETYNRDRNTGTTSPLKLANNPIWHQYRILNETSFPWTTGPALLMKGLIPLGQELLTYTPRGGEVLVPVTVAVDVRASYEEEILARDENVVSRNGHSYDRITKRMKITVQSYREVASRTRVGISMGGEVFSASDDGRILLGEPNRDDWSNNNLFNHALNPHSNVTFEVDLEAGESHTFEIEFTLLAY